MWYVGSKRALSKEIMPFINQGLRVFPNGMYIEPFVGGCNMIDKVQHHTKIGYDANKYLIALLKKAQTNPDSLIKTGIKSRKAYKYVKANMNLFQEAFVGQIGFMSTFKNMWMSSFVEDINPEWFEKSVKGLMKQDLSSFHLVNSDYRSIPVGRGNVIYCDPPYRIYDYYKMPFNHDEFYQWVINVSKDNIVLVSEYEMPQGFKCIWHKTVIPKISTKRAKPKVEKLFIYKG